LYFWFDFQLIYNNPIYHLCLLLIFNVLHQKKKKKVANCKYIHKFLYLQTKYEKSVQKIVVRIAAGVYPFDIVVYKLEMPQNIG
ncbi:MAG: hypothetical protein J6W45_07670, partial [Bacteroidales bacterium]|nr:hypothetical protein [Bacteroidales bacterium]